MKRAIFVLAVGLFWALATGCSDEQRPIGSGTSGGTGSTGSTGSTGGTGDTGTRDGSGGPLGCTIDCECPQGEACVLNSCVASNPGTFCCANPGCATGRSCVDYGGRQNVCGVLTTCLNACDCPQGMDCVENECTVSTTPVFCCSNAGCLSGRPCVLPNGSPGTC